jgi:hypothetical protein
MSRDNCAIAQWGQGTKERASYRRRRRAELDHVTELQRKQRQLQWMRHALSVRVTEAAETKYRLNHVGEAVAGRYLNPYAGVLVATRVPPVVPQAGLADSGFTLTEDAGLPGELHSQLTLKHGEMLNESGMAARP